MPTSIYDSSLLTKRRSEKTIAGSFLSRLYPPINPTTKNPISQPQQSFGSILGISSDSIMNNARWIASNNSNQCLVAGQTTGTTAGIFTSNNGIDWSNVGGSYNTFFTANTMTCVASNLPPF